MNIKKIIDATIIGAQKEQKTQRGLQSLSHETHIAYYAAQQYQYLQACNPYLPNIPELDQMADSQFPNTNTEVGKCMRRGLLGGGD